MGDSEPRNQPASGPESDKPSNPVTLADTEEDLIEHGRIGYGRYGKWTPLGLAILLLLTILALGIAAALRDNDDEEPAARQAPDFELALMDGSTFHLADYRGKVVVLNFWASWCAPCKDEMPALQQAASTVGPDVVIVGVGAKKDTDTSAAEFLTTYGVTYPVGRDTAGGDKVVGAVAQAYGVFAYPATVVITPEGMISSFTVKPLESGELEQYIAQAQS